MNAFFDRMSTMTTTLKFLLPGALMLSSAVVSADTLVLQAIDDFPIRDSGAVPYYTEPGRGSLAIDASDINFRNEYAKAETTFSGDSGSYDVTLIGLAELDGEAPYRFSVNDSLVGEVVNPETRVDFLPVAHRFTNVILTTGDVLAVESLANSNDKIPENGGFAFARGRWTELRLTPHGETDVQPGKVSLISTATNLTEAVNVGDNVVVDYAAINEASADATATNVRMLIHVPPEFSVADVPQCTATDDVHSNDTVLTCGLSELAPGESASGQIQLEAKAITLNTLLDVTVIAAQRDIDGADNLTRIEFSVGPASEPAPEPTPEITLVSDAEQESEPTSAINVDTDSETEIESTLSGIDEPSAVDETFSEPDDSTTSSEVKVGSGGSLNVISIFTLLLLVAIRRRVLP